MFLSKRACGMTQGYITAKLQMEDCEFVLAVHPRILRENFPGARLRSTSASSQADFMNGIRSNRTATMHDDHR
jgi:hypothetical protein